MLGTDPARAGGEWREQIGVVLQSSAMYETLTPTEMLRLFAGYYREPRPVDEVIELVGLQEKRDDRVRRLSGGQRRRLDLGLALIGDPELIFLDEPTTGFDPAARRRAWETIRGLRGLGKTILLTTHYLDEAEQLADRVAVLAHGRIVASGTPAELTGVDARDGDPLPRERQRGRARDRRADARAERADRPRPRRGPRARRPGRPPSDARGGLPEPDRGERRVRLYWHELKGELLLYTRSRELAFFTFLLPMIFFVLLGSTYGHDTIEGVKGSHYLEAGMIGYGAISIAFAGLAIVLVIRRESGILKRLRATPLPAPAYIVALLASFLAAFAVEVAGLILLGARLVRDPGSRPGLARWSWRCCSARSPSAGSGSA